MKFKAENHNVGKVYDLNEENMHAMILEIDKLRAQTQDLKDILNAIAEQPYFGKEPLSVTFARIGLATYEM